MASESWDRIFSSFNSSGAWPDCPKFGAVDVVNTKYWYLAGRSLMASSALDYRAMPLRCDPEKALDAKLVLQPVGVINVLGDGRL